MNSLQSWLGTLSTGATGILGALNSGKTDAANAKAAAAQQQAATANSYLKYGLIAGGGLLVLLVIGMMFRRK
jgi:CHASE3 domain sensor protein